MKLCAILILISLLVARISCVAFTWNGSANDNNFNNQNNWTPTGVPSGGDSATFPLGTNVVSVTATATVDTITVQATSLRLIVTGGATLNFNTDFITAGGLTIQVDQGSSFLSSNYVTLNGAVSFINFGTINMNAIFSPGATISNIQNGNPVVFTGTKNNKFVSGNYVIPSGFSFDTSRLQVFEATVATATITFKYAETISSNNWQVVNDVASITNFVFEGGLNVNGQIQLKSSLVANPRPLVTFAGTITITNSANWDVSPTFGNGQTPLTFNGGSITFPDKSPVFVASALQGTSTITISNSDNNNNQAVTFSNDISISNPNLVFTGRYQTAGAGVVTFTVPYSFGFSLQLNSNFVFQKSFTFASGFSILTGGNGQYTFTDSVTNNVGGGIDFLATSVVADCNFPSKAFNFAGNSYTFTGGLTIKGCTVTAAGTLTLNAQVRTDGGNSTLPSNINLQYIANTFTFRAVGTPTNSRYGLTLTGAQTIPSSRVWTANNVEVITTGTFSIQDSSQLTSSNGGLFSFNGVVAISSSVSISATTAFASGAQSITTSNRCDWSGLILLRNSILGGTGEIWFTGNLQVTKGLSNITNPNFRFKSAKTITYQWDQVLPNTGATLTVNSNGATATRTIEGGITSNEGVNIVFDDTLTFNNTGAITGTAGTGSNPPGCVTFRTFGLTQSNIFATASTTLTFGKFIFFNHTNTHLQGSGTYSFTSATVWLQGGLNSPSVNGDAVGTFTNDGTINLFTDSTVGNTILFNGGLTADDLDNNDQVASKTLTLASSTTQLREVRGLVNKANIVIGGNVLLLSNTANNNIGYTQINGNSVILAADITWNNLIIFNGGATTITSQDSTPRTIQLGEVTGNPTHGLNLASALFINTPVTLNLLSLVSVNFANGVGLGGSGIISAQDVFFNAGSAVAISPQTLTLNNATFVGTGSFTLNPADGKLNTRNGIQATVAVTYPGSIFNQVADTVLSPLVSFTANPVTIQGGTTLTIDNGGSSSITTNWINNINIVFNSPLTIQTTGSLTGNGALTFNNTLTLTQAITLSQSITFGFDPNYVFALQNTGFNLTLTGSVITAKGVILPSGFIVSTSPANNLQTITGGGVINGNWVWTNSVMFGTLNVTGARTLNFDLYVLSGATACFVSGVTLNTGTFLADANGPGTLLIEPFLENNGQNTFGTTLTTRFSRGSTGVFEFRGTVPMMINSTVLCEAQFQFTQNVIFGWISATTSNDLTFKTFCTNWFNTAAVVQVWRNTVTVNNDVKVNIFPQIIFGMNNSNPVAINVQAGPPQGTLIFLGDLTIVGKTFNTATGISMGSIKITTLQNSTLNTLTLTGPLNFVSTTSPWVEPTVTFANGLSQTIILTGPVKLDNPTFNSGSGFSGPSRLAITTGFIAASSFTFGVPVQFYVNTQGQFFAVDLQNFGTVVTLGYSPSLFNPLFVNSNFPLNLRVTGTTDQNNRFYLFANTSFALGNIDVPRGVFHLSSSQTTPQTITARDITIGGTKGTFWIDNVNVNAQTITFADGSSTSPGSVFQFTISSLNPPRLNVATAFYKGSATVTVSNFNWDGTAVTAIQATRSFQTMNTPFAVTSGTPGFQYKSARSNENAQFTRSANPSVVPFPTQSNGPSPAVSGASVISINMCIVALVSVLMFFF